MHDGCSTAGGTTQTLNPQVLGGFAILHTGLETGRDGNMTNETQPSSVEKDE